ncbi:hypothetical protein [Actinacidiphila glaucinigra]|uniref:hypothetical protein n=1 Tax=Actinacidiphila glaucinigra TaxID=235986 RepID=UPI0035DB96EE
MSTPDPDAGAVRPGNGGTDAAGSGTSPVTLSARVVTVGRSAAATGAVVVDVAVPAADGPALAAQVATGNISLVVVARDGS